VTVTRGDLLHLFRQALKSDNGSVRIRLADEDEAIRLRRRCYKMRDRLRQEQQRRRTTPLMAYDAKGNPIGLLAVVGGGRTTWELEAVYDCLRFRVIGRDLVIQRFDVRVRDEHPAHTGALPEARELGLDEIDALPPWPLRSARDRRGRFVDRQTW